MVSGVVQSGGTSPDPIVGAMVTLYQAGTFAQGAPTQLGSPATTDGSGSFSIPYTNPDTDVTLYLVAVGGSTSGPSNSAIVLLSVLGPADTAPESVVVNELTTAASAYAVSNFTTTSATAPRVKIVDTNTPELAVGAATLNNLVNIETGGIGALISNGNNNPRRLNSLANALTSCVRLTTSCSTGLFNDTTVNSVAPTTTLDAALNVNRATRAVLNAIKSLSGLETLGSSGPYSPVLTSAPADWTIPLAYNLGTINSQGFAVAIDGHGKVFDAILTTCDSSGSPCVYSITPGSSTVSLFSDMASVSSAVSMAVDTSGNVWIPRSSPDNLLKFSPAGGAPTTFSDSSLNAPEGIAVDSVGNLWIANKGGNNAILFTVSDNMFQSFTGSMSSPYGIAIDGSGNVWITNSGNNTVTVLNSSGTPLSFSPLTTGSLNSPQAITIDKSGNVWVLNAAPSGSVTKYTTSTNPPSAANFTSATFDIVLAQSIEADGLGNIWFSNFAQNNTHTAFNIMELDSTGKFISPSFGYEDNAQLNLPEGLAIDGAGNVWVANENNTLLVEFVGAAGGVKTPFIGPILPP